MAIKEFFKKIMGGNTNDGVTETKPKRQRSQKKPPNHATEKLSPKEIANKRNEPWVDVIKFHVNSENIRHGFFELDWNDQFIQELKTHGYGFDGDPDEEIVGRWYREICYNAAAEEGIDMSDREIGYINVRKLQNGRSEIG